MVDKGLGLDQTKPGKTLNKELIEMQEKHKKEIDQMAANMKRAIAEKDEEWIDALAENQRDFQDNIDSGNEQIEELRTNMNNVKQEREEEFRRIQAELKQTAMEYERKVKEWENYKANNAVMARASSTVAQKTTITQLDVSLSPKKDLNTPPPWRYILAANTSED